MSGQLAGAEAVEDYLSQRVMPSPPFRLASRGVAWAIVTAPGLWPLLRRPTQRIWDRVGSEWDQNIKPDSLDHTAPLAAACEQIRPAPHAILELGTGTGAGARLLAARFPQAEIVGADLAETMIAAARTNTPADLAGRLTFTVADAASLSYRDAAFDLVVYLNIPPFIGQLARVLRPGGHVIIANSFGAGTPSYVPERTLRRGLQRHGLHTIATGTAHAGTFLVARHADHTDEGVRGALEVVRERHEKDAKL